MRAQTYTQNSGKASGVYAANHNDTMPSLNVFGSPNPPKRFFFLSFLCRFRRCVSNRKDPALATRGTSNNACDASSLASFFHAGGPLLLFHHNSIYQRWIYVLVSGSCFCLRLRMLASALIERQDRVVSTERLRNTLVSEP